VENYPSVSFDWTVNSCENANAVPPVQLQPITENLQHKVLLELRKSNQHLRPESGQYRQLVKKSKAHANRLSGCLSTMLLIYI